MGPRAPQGAGGPPPLRPSGLVLHHDGRWSHEGTPIANARLRALFDRSVRYLSEERAYVVQVGKFRGGIAVEEAAFFVRDFDAASGALSLSDGSREPLDVATLRPSPRDAALLCQVKGELASGGLPARFSHAAQAELLHAAEEENGRRYLRLAGARVPLPPL